MEYYSGIKKKDLLMDAMIQLPLNALCGVQETRLKRLGHWGGEMENHSRWRGLPDGHSAHMGWHL
jgi:hypothetical protein